MARKRAKQPEERKRDPTLVMFLALNMILLAFFILLVALSQPDVTTEAELRIQVQKAFRTFGGTFLGLGRFVEQTGVSRDESLSEVNELERFLGEVSRFVEENPEAKVLSYEIVSEGLHIHLSGAFSFEEGSDLLREEALPVYDAIYNMILRTRNDVRIEGHTDNVPVRTLDVRDNWHLSALRATQVFRYFTAKGEIDPGRFEVVGYGDAQPLASNLSADGRARNRRVTIVFVGDVLPADEP